MWRGAFIHLHTSSPPESTLPTIPPGERRYQSPVPRRSKEVHPVTYTKLPRSPTCAALPPTGPDLCYLPSVRPAHGGARLIVGGLPTMTTPPTPADGFRPNLSEGINLTSMLLLASQGRGLALISLCLDCPYPSSSVLDFGCGLLLMLALLVSALSVWSDTPLTLQWLVVFFCGESNHPALQ